MLAEHSPSVTNLFHVTKSIFYKTTFSVFSDKYLTNRHQHVAHIAWKCMVIADLSDCGIVYTRGATECTVISSMRMWSIQKVFLGMSRIFRVGIISTCIYISMAWSTVSCGCCEYRATLWEESFERTVHWSTSHCMTTSFGTARCDRIQMFSTFVAFAQKIGFVTSPEHRPTTFAVRHNHYTGLW